jgi:hypothetical protein
MRKHKVTFLLLFLCTSTLLAQKNIGISLNNKALYIFKNNNAIKKTLQSTKLPAPPSPTIPLAYDYNRLGFFCKLEVRCDKQNTAPIRFRLGSLEYSNFLEGK